ncbi:hypothetical protein F383_15368 [Gossypium arboreum]|uniref:Uncharacterized protein n=1 Tax=Gossypium arboreum TaxID=29729 RepID=A0A0B0N9N2_GOSAR|nr:hypothetical protein F383_15368 [Gossypium arboreum]
MTYFRPHEQRHGRDTACVPLYFN